MQSLRSYQKTMNDRLPDVLRGVRGVSVRRALVVAPCGSGKTTMGMDLARRAAGKGNGTLIVAPRRRLVRQWAERAAELGVPHGVLMADLPEDRAANPWAIHDPHAPVQIASRDTLFSRADRDGVPRANLVILDEAHLNSDRFLRIEAATGCTVLVGLTATPCRPDGSGLPASTWHLLIEAVTIQDLLAMDPPCLVPVSVYAPAGVATKRRRGLKVKCAGDPVRQWLDHATGRKTVTFCRTTAESRAVRDSFLAAGVRAAHIDAHTPDQERDEVIARLQDGGLDVVSNVDVIGLGVDIPDVDCVQLLTNCVSPVRLWQTVGRCQRPAPGKTGGMLLDHAAATAEHGMPNVSPAWALGEQDSVQNRARLQMREDPAVQPVVCRQCGLVSAGTGVCPGCESRLFVPTAQPVRTGREPLSLYTGNDTPVAKPLRQREWERRLYLGAAKGWTCGQAAASFKRRFGVWPEAAGVAPLYEQRDARALISDVLPQFERRRKGASS